MSGNIKLNTPSNGSVTLSTPDTASAVTVTIPAATDTVTLNTQAQTLTNKTLLASGSNTVEATSGPSSTQISGNRNKIINGAMMIDQRNAGAAINPATNNAYCIDRWLTNSNVASKFSVQQNAGAVTPPAGYKNYLGATSLSSYSAGSTDSFALVQKIEGYNIADLSWGTASAKTITISFQVYSSLTGTFGGAIWNSDGSRSYPFSYTISSANTWTPISVVISGDTTGTWLTDNGIGLWVWFSLGQGSTNSGTAGSWSSSGYRSVTGAVSVVGTNGATWYITGVQLEKGTAATPFENRLYGTELALCQRYCWNMNYVPGQNYVRFSLGLNINTTTNVTSGIPLPVTMRTIPTLTWSGGIQDLYDTGATGNVVTIGSDTNNGALVSLIATYNSGTVNANKAAGFRINNTASWSAIFSAEL